MLIFALLAQVTPVQPMPKGTALPPSGSDEAAVLVPINAVFAAFETGDAAAMLRHVYPEGRVTAAGPRPSCSSARRAANSSMNTAMSAPIASARAPR